MNIGRSFFAVLVVGVAFLAFNVNGSRFAFAVHKDVCTWAPDKIPHVADFRAACKAHDDCYDTPLRSRKGCDEGFLRDQRNWCEKHKGKRGLAACLFAAKAYYEFIKLAGQPFYVRAQLRSIKKLRFALQPGERVPEIVQAVVWAIGRFPGEKPEEKPVRPVGLAWTVTQSNGYSKSGYERTNKEGKIVIDLSETEIGVPGVVKVQVVAVGKAKGEGPSGSKAFTRRCKKKGKYDHFSYPTVCIPPPPPDLNCSAIPYRNFKVGGSDPHRFDRDGDGVACES